MTDRALDIRHLLERNPFSIDRGRRRDGSDQGQARSLLAQRVFSGLGDRGDAVIAARIRLARTAAERELFQLVGLRFPAEEANEILERVRAHQWIEAEKAGRDIWAERDPRWPQRAAAREWFESHYALWRRWREASGSRAN